MIKKIIFALLLFLLSPVAFAKEDITLYFFHGDGCPHCAEEEIFLDNLQEEYPDLKIVSYEVWYNEENSSFLKKVGQELGFSSLGVPKTIIGNSVISGYSDAVGRKIERAVEYYQTHDYQDAVSQIKDGTYVSKEEDEFNLEEEKTDQELSVTIPFLGNVNVKNFSLMSAASLLGLLDGFNPCAMWVLLFLISVLLGMKNRKRMIILGFTFLLTSGVFYFLLLFSWINVAVEMTTIIWLRNIIALVALIGGFFHLKSFFTKSDGGCEVVDEKRRKKVFQKIKKFCKEKNLIFALIGVIGLAISVNFIELACSLGLPLVFTELLAINKVSFFLRVCYSLVYVFFFLADDFIVFLIAITTMRTTGLSTKYHKYSHLLGGVIMIVVGALLLFKPEWLMFSFQ